MLIGSSDPVSEVPNPIGRFEFLPIRGAQPNQNRCVESSDKVSEVPITIGSFELLPTNGARPTQNQRVGLPMNTFSAKNRNTYSEKN